MASELAIAERVSLAPLGTLGVGGAARWFVRATAAADVAAADEWCRSHGVDLFVLGGGSNLVVADAGFDGLVLHNEIRGLEFTGPGQARMVAGAGETWDAAVAASVERGLGGIECLSGIPGRVGGTPIQNVGAYGQDVSETIESVSAFDRATRTLVTLPAAECGFAYRMSRFKGADARRFIVTQVSFQLREGLGAPSYPDVLAYLRERGITAPAVADLREAVLAIRRRKGMVLDPLDPDTRSVGSFFMNPVVTLAQRDAIAAVAGEPPSFPVDAQTVKVPAAWLIERAGFQKGYRDGAMGISTKHPLALVNRGGATARDVLRLAARIKHGVADRFGVRLRPEPIFVGFQADPEVDFLRL